jgi:hypothetical protein
MPRGIYKRKKASKRGPKVVKRALPAQTVRELSTEVVLAPALPAGWEAQHDRRELASKVRFSIVLQCDVPEVEFDRERANELAMELGHRMEALLPRGSALVLVATEEPDA